MTPANTSHLTRIVKMISAVSAGIGVTFLSQFLLPPCFLHTYGVARYGEWLVLSGTLGFLSNLNFGITTYASNELTILHKRGHHERFRALQGSTLALLLVMALFGTLICLSALLLPLDQMLHITHLSRRDAQWTACLLGLQAMVHLIAAYYNQMFLLVELPHRGTSWSNLRRLSWVVGSLPPLFLHMSFSCVACGQFITVLLVSIASIVDLKYCLGPISLGLSGANWATARAALTPSGMFAMISAQQFLIYQAPVILLQWMLGPTVVVVFSTSRTILATARQALQAITQAISPEVTFSFAEQDHQRMLQIYHYSEKIVFSLIPIVNMSAFLFAPVLLAIWLHRSWLFDPWTYGLMALISGVQSMREHKQFFQFSTNRHHRLAIIVFFGNLLMVAASYPAILWFQLSGFMLVWLVSEFAQMVLIYYENKMLFRNHPSIRFRPVLVLVAVLFGALSLSSALAYVAVPRGLAAVIFTGIIGSLVIMAASYRLLGMDAVILALRSRRQRILQPS